MRRATRVLLLILLFVVCVLSLPSPPLVAAQTGATEEGPEAFVPTERLPAGSAVSFPVDI